MSSACVGGVVEARRPRPPVGRDSAPSKSVRSSSPTSRVAVPGGQHAVVGEARARRRGTGRPAGRGRAWPAVAIGIGRRMTNIASRCQKPSSSSVTAGRADGPAVHAVPDDREDRRQDHDRAERGKPDHGDAGVGERAQEVLLEDEQRHQAGGDRHGGEQHGPPGGPDRPAHGVGNVVAGGQLLTEAGDHEQRVVDGEPEPHRRREVQREDRHVGRGPDQRQHERRCPTIAKPADHQGQQGGGDRAEDQHEQDRGDREGDHLGGDQVLLDDLVDLGEGGAPRRRRRRR